MAKITIVENSQEYLSRPIDASSLAIFRMCFGFILGWYAFYNISSNAVFMKYIEPKFLFALPLFDFLHLKVLSVKQMYTLFQIMGVSACTIALGIFYRASLIIFFLSFGYMLLLDKSSYNNHYYLILLITFLFFFMGAHKCWSMDALRNPKLNTRIVPFWNIFILRAQFCIVFFYAGLTKINKDFLDGKHMYFWLEENNAPQFLQSLLNSSFAIQLFIHASILFDLSIGFLLCYKRTRLLGIVLAIIFHSMNSWFFKFTIGIFPYFMIASLILFVDPEEPRILFNNIRGLWNRSPITSSLEGQRTQASFQKWKRQSFIFVVTYLTIQALLPLQHHLYPSNVNWTREGSRYSWRLKPNITTGYMSIMTTDPKTNESEIVIPFGDINSNQYLDMMINPDMLIQYIYFLKKRYRSQGIENPIIRADVRLSVNGRPSLPLIDRNVNLAEVEYPVFSHFTRQNWILPPPEDLGY